jgi:DNA-binding NarL/FixJ family response regulator
MNALREEDTAAHATQFFLPFECDVMSSIKVLLVDDSPDFLDSAADFLARNSRIEIVGRAHSGHDGVRLAKELSPDLVLIDVSMADLSGLDVTRRVKKEQPPPKVVIVTLHSTIAYRAAAADAGADGFVNKAEFAESLLPMIFELFPVVDGLSE